MLVVPEFGDYPDIFAPQSGAKGGGERLPDARFVAVDRGAIDVAIADREGIFDGGSGLDRPKRDRIRMFRGRSPA